MTDMERNKAAAVELFAHLTAGDIAGALNGLTDDATWWIIGKPAAFPSAGTYNKERLARLFNRMMSQLKNGLQMTVTGVIAEGDKVALEATSYGELINGRVYEQTYHFLIEFRDGRISVVREYIDTQHAHAIWVQPVHTAETVNSSDTRPEYS